MTDRDGDLPQTWPFVSCSSTVVLQNHKALRMRGTEIWSCLNTSASGITKRTPGVLLEPEGDTNAQGHLEETVSYQTMGWTFGSCSGLLETARGFTINAKFSD